MDSNDEVIVGVLAPAEVLAGIAAAGREAIFADLDLETMSLTPATVLDQVTVHTRAVYVTPVHGVLGPWETLAKVTEPRNIPLQVEGRGGTGKWEPIAPGLRGMASHLVQVDPQLILGGATGFSEELAAFGIEAGRLADWPGRRRDYPGMARIEQEVLVVAGWQDRVEELRAAAQITARQAAFDFGQSRKLPLRQGLDHAAIRRAG